MPGVTEEQITAAFGIGKAGMSAAKAPLTILLRLRG